MLVDGLVRPAVELALLVAIHLPGLATFAFCLEASRTFYLPRLWDPSIVIAGVVGGTVSYPFHASVAGTASGVPLGIGFPLYRSAATGIGLACTCAIILIWLEGSGRVEPPEPLAPIGERFRGRQYE